MKRFKFVTAILLALIMLSGCVQSGPASGSAAEAPASESAAPAVEAAPDATVVTYWGWDNNFYEAAIAAFTEANPSVKVEATPLAHADYLTKIQQTVASGSKLPDILLGESNLRGKLFELDIWDDLTQAPYNVSQDMFFDFISNRTLNPKGELVGIEQSIPPAW